MNAWVAIEGLLFVHNISAIRRRLRSFFFLITCLKFFFFCFYFSLFHFVLCFVFSVLFIVWSLFVNFIAITMFLILLFFLFNFSVVFHYFIVVAVVFVLPFNYIFFNLSNKFTMWLTLNEMHSLNLCRSGINNKLYFATHIPYSDRHFY